MIALAHHHETTSANQPPGQRTIAELTKQFQHPGCPPGNAADYSSISGTLPESRNHQLRHFISAPRFIPFCSSGTWRDGVDLSWSLRN